MGDAVARRCTTIELLELAAVGKLGASGAARLRVKGPISPNGVRSGAKVLFAAATTPLDRSRDVRARLADRHLVVGEGRARGAAIVRAKLRESIDAPGALRRRRLQCSSTPGSDRRPKARATGRSAASHRTLAGVADVCASIRRRTLGGGAALPPLPGSYARSMLIGATVVLMPRYDGGEAARLTDRWRGELVHVSTLRGILQLDDRRARRDLSSVSRPSPPQCRARQARHHRVFPPGWSRSSTALRERVLPSGRGGRQPAGSPRWPGHELRIAAEAASARRRGRSLRPRPAMTPLRNAREEPRRLSRRSFTRLSRMARRRRIPLHRRPRTSLSSAGRELLPA